jgi:hypothetical protein
MPEDEVKTRNYSVVLLTHWRRCGVQDEIRNKTRNTVLIERKGERNYTRNGRLQRMTKKWTRQSQQQWRKERKKGKKDKLKVDTKKEKENGNKKNTLLGGPNNEMCAWRRFSRGNMVELAMLKKSHSYENEAQAMEVWSADMFSVSYATEQSNVYVQAFIMHLFCWK